MGSIIKLQIGFFILVCLAYGTLAGAESYPASQKDLDEIMYVTPDFQLLPASAFSLEEGTQIYKWMFSGHVLELIPRPGGYKVTLRYDNGTIQSRLFTEFSNGKPFPPTRPGSHEWAYTLNSEEIKTAMTFYGQKMTVGEFIEKVAPQELEIMDDTIRAMAYSVPYMWQDPEGPGSPWTLQMSRSSMSSTTTAHIEDEETLLPDLSDVPVGTEIRSGPGWELEIKVQEDSTNYTSMAAFYQKRHPEVWNSLSADKQRELEQEPPRFGYVVISRTLNDKQKKIIRGIWGSAITNAEYFALVWPDLLAAMPVWERESGWWHQAKIWEEENPEEKRIPEDYVDFSHVNANAAVLATAAASTTSRSVGIASSAVSTTAEVFDTGTSSPFMAFKVMNLDTISAGSHDTITFHPLSIVNTQNPVYNPVQYDSVAISTTFNNRWTVPPEMTHTNDLITMDVVPSSDLHEVIVSNSFIDMHGFV